MAIFGLEVSNIIAIVAVCVAGLSSTVTAVAFLKTYGRNRKSEQIKIAREIWDKLKIARSIRHEFLLTNVYPDKGTVEDKSKWITDHWEILRDVFGPLLYFTYLVQQKEIDDTSVLNYYKKGVFILLEELDGSYDIIEERMKLINTLTTPAVTGIDISSTVAEIRHELSVCVEVWESISKILRSSDINMPP